MILTQVYQATPYSLAPLCGERGRGVRAISAGQGVTRTSVIRVNGRQLVRTSQLVEAQWAARAVAQAGEGAEIVDDETGQVIERHPPQTTR
jgi:hypothetical protein